ncbi:MAG: FkbM family methyltransferase [Chitinophagaceae bacterium]
MTFSLSRAANCIDKFGLWNGFIIYFKLKFNQLNKIHVPGILYPISLRKNTSDKAVFDQVFLQDAYALEISFAPKIIIDAGANIGLFSVLMKNKFPNATIIAIEPDMENMELLKKNCVSYAGLKPVLAGLWSEDCKLKLIDEQERGKSGIMVIRGNESDSIKGISLDSILSTFNIEKIDLLKIDIECSEKELFSTNYENWLPKTKMIIIELHDWIGPGCGEVFFKAIQKSMPNYRYTICGENTIIENLDL